MFPRSHSLVNDRIGIIIQPAGLQSVHLTTRCYIEVNAKTLKIRVIIRGQQKPLDKLWGPSTSLALAKSLIYKHKYHETSLRAITVVAIQRNEKNHTIVK